MKKLLIAAVLGFSALQGGNAQAATTSGNFNVNITLTSVCTLSTITDVAFAYTSFQAAASTGTGGGYSVTCTNTLPYTMALDATNTTDAAVNLSYVLALSAASGTGNGAAQAFTVNGTMAANQSGNCATATCTNAASANKGRTLTVTY